MADFHRWVAAPDETAHDERRDLLRCGGGVRPRRPLLKKAKAALIEAMARGASISARFATCREAFPRRRSACSTIRIDGRRNGAPRSKKGGIFPIVHGVRALALEHGLTNVHHPPNRIRKLAEHNVLQARNFRATTWIQSLPFPQPAEA